ncbi:4'-phosphopantetheinyl transferase superfamily protein [Pedobacter sp. P351]|uniref:4'-phosphopantetheinyl transferase family protein n=1 Tax=Pedobacter superstes TaxID=3133441 RepID=UPI0030A8D5E0
MALAYHKKLDDSTEFAIWKIEESAEELYAQLQLRDHEEKVLDGLNNGKRNLHWLSTRVLLRQLLKTENYIDCQVDEHGKPYLPDSSFHISFSHSFDYAAVMISKDKAVGIDIEMIKDKIERVAHKFLVKEEIAFMDPLHKIEHLYICWCAKEAIYKLQGKRNVSFKDDIRLQTFPYSKAGNFQGFLETDHSLKKFDVYFERFENYMLGYVAGGIEMGNSSSTHHQNASK